MRRLVPYSALLLFCTAAAVPTRSAWAQVTAAAPGASANTTQRGTVTSVASGSLVIATDAKGELTVTPADGARVVQLAPGSKDLSSATAIRVGDIAVGDRVLVTGHAGASPGSVSAARIILMKSSDIASLHATQSADWQKRGSGGLVKAVDGSTLTVSSGMRTVSVATTPTTIFRRYAGDSIKFEDAKAGSLSEIKAGDQLRVRGARSEDGTTLTAEEIVSGSFENLSGPITSVDASAGTVTLKDLTTKKSVTMRVTANSELRHLTPEAASAFARTHPAGGGGAAPAGSAAAAPTSAAARPRPAGEGEGSGAAHTGRGGGDLSQMLPHLPAETIADLKPGEAVIVVASTSSADQTVTAITMLTGVEQILSSSSGASSPTLSPWNLEGGGGGDAGQP